MKATLLLLALSLAGLGVYAFQIWAAESLYTHRGSLAYWMCISRTIRNVPEIGVATDVIFYSSAGDGPKRPTDAVSYSTDASRDRIVSELTRYFQDLGVSVSFDDSNHHFSPFRASVAPSSQKERLEVTVTETY
jgi:hypothetical protein